MPWTLVTPVAQWKVPAEWEGCGFEPDLRVESMTPPLRRALLDALKRHEGYSEQALSLLQTVLPDICVLRDVSLEDFGQHSALLPEDVRKRARHVVTECARVDDAMRLLAVGDAAGFGKIMFAGHASLRDDYEVSCPELDLLVETARRLPGCWGARLTGAGFGGCTVNLVEDGLAGSFIEGLKTGYQQGCGRSAEVYLCRASRGVTVEVK